MSFKPATALMQDSQSMFTVKKGLVGEVNVRWPNRDHASDGWIGDPSHAARYSEHNPCWTCTGSMYGVVLAVDIDNNGAPGEMTDIIEAVLKAAIGHRLVYYVIWNGKIYSRTYGWRPREYTGSNPHDKHVHISLLKTPAVLASVTWLAKPPYAIKQIPVSVSKVRAQFIAASRGQKVTVNNGVARLQRFLNKAVNAGLTVDGVVGKATLAAWARFEKDNGLGQSRIPDRKSLARFARKSDVALVA